MGLDDRECLPLWRQHRRRAIGEKERFVNTQVLYTQYSPAPHVAHARCFAFGSAARGSGLGLGSAVRLFMATCLASLDSCPSYCVAVSSLALPRSCSNCTTAESRTGYRHSGQSALSKSRAQHASPTASNLPAARPDLLSITEVRAEQVHFI